MTLDDHRNLLKGSIACTLPDSVYCHLALTCAGKESGHRVGGSHAEIIVAMSGKDRLVNAVDVVDKVFDLGAVLGRKTVSGGVRNIDHCRSGLDDGLNYLCKVFVVGAPCILRIEFNIFDILLRILDSSYRALENLFAGGIELVLDMRIRCAYSSMNPLVLGILESIDSDINIFLHGSGERADYRPGNSLGDFSN